MNRMDRILKDWGPMMQALADQDKVGLEGKKSTHKVEVVPVSLRKHENADSLSIIDVFGYTCVGRTSDWQGVEKAAWIPPDSLVDTNRVEFDFLTKDAKKADGFARIKAKKLRGVVSFGLLIPARPEWEIGQDVADILGVKHYEPGPGSNKAGGGLYTGGDVSSPPDLGFNAPKYDVDAFRRYAKMVFEQGEPVVVTEKIHGANGRFVFHNGQMYCGSRTEWKKEFSSYDHLTVDGIANNILKANQRNADNVDFVVVTEDQARTRAEELINRLKSQEPKQNMWWKALAGTPSLRKFCEENPGMVVYGEVYGAVQDLPYGHKKGQVSFVAFDVMKDGRWMDAVDGRLFLEQYGVPQVPLFNKRTEAVSSADNVEPIPYDFDQIAAMAEGKTLMPNDNHVREGVVVKPFVERWNPTIGRVILKVVGAGYLERSKDDPFYPDNDEEHSMV
jgi:RNA ligase (TIGR02306 family)